MTQNILIVIPLQEEYSDLYHSLSALDLKSYVEKIGKLDVHCFPDLNVTLARGGHGKTQFGIQTQHLLDHAKFDLVICAGAARRTSRRLGRSRWRVISRSAMSLT
ncbi:MAG TPA: hypothetical protein VF896_09270 [Anaerolineales bacterium]